MPPRQTRAGALAAARTTLGTAAQDKPDSLGTSVAFKLEARGAFKSVALVQTLLVYGLDTDTALRVVDALIDKQTQTVVLPNVPDIPIFLMGARDCGITAIPLPF